MIRGATFKLLEMVVPSLIDPFKAEVARLAYPLFSNRELADYVGCSVAWLEKLAQQHGLKKARARHNLKDYGLPIDLEGMVFGKLTVIEKMPYKSKSNIVWLCRCECGRECRLRSNVLVRGFRDDCPACDRERIRIQTRSSSNCVWWSKLVSHARERGISFEICLEDAVDLFERQQGRCAISGLPIKLAHFARTGSDGTASLDRIDSDFGYTKDNIQWVFKDINLMKNKHPQDYFIQICEAVADHQRSIKVSYDQALINIDNPN